MDDAAAVCAEICPSSRTRKRLYNSNRPGLRFADSETVGGGLIRSVLRNRGQPDSIIQCRILAVSASSAKGSQSWAPFAESPNDDVKLPLRDPSSHPNRPSYPSPMNTQSLCPGATSHTNPKDAHTPYTPPIYYTTTYHNMRLPRTLLNPQHIPYKVEQPMTYSRCVAVYSVYPTPT